MKINEYKKKNEKKEYYQINYFQEFHTFWSPGEKKAFFLH